ARLRELWVLVFFAGWEARAAGRRDPDVALVVDVNRVLVRGPLVAVALAAPALDVVAGGVKLHHRRRRVAAFRVGVQRFLVARQRPGPLQDPDVIARVDAQPSDLSE